LPEESSETAQRILVADDDPAILRSIAVGRSKDEETAADKEALAILKKSPYKDSLQKVGLFLRLMDARGNDLPQLIRPLLGNRLADTRQEVRLTSVMALAPGHSPERFANNPRMIQSLTKARSLDGGSKKLRYALGECIVRCRGSHCLGCGRLPLPRSFLRYLRHPLAVLAGCTGDNQSSDELAASVRG